MARIISYTLVNAMSRAILLDEVMIKQLRIRDQNFVRRKHHNQILKRIPPSLMIRMPFSRFCCATSYMKVFAFHGLNHELRLLVQLMHEFWLVKWGKFRARTCTQPPQTLSPALRGGTAGAHSGYCRFLTLLLVQKMPTRKHRHWMKQGYNTC